MENSRSQNRSTVYYSNLIVNIYIYIYICSISFAVHCGHFYRCRIFHLCKCGSEKGKYSTT